MKPWVKRLVTAAASASLVGVGWAFFPSASRVSAPAVEAAGTGVSLKRGWALDWPANAEYRYSLEWRARTTAEVEAAGSDRPTFAASVDLAADCTWHSYGKRDGSLVIGLSLQNIRRAELEALGAPIFGNEQKAIEALSKAQVVVELGRDGAWRRVYFEPGQPAAVKEVLRALLSEAQFIVAPDDSVSWNSEEKTPLGTAQASYRVDPADATRVQRSRVRYLQLAALGGTAQGVTQEIDSVATLQVEPQPAGLLKSLEHRERFTARRERDGRSVLASENFIQLRLLQIAPAAPGSLPNLAQLQAIRPGEIIPSPESERAILEQHAAKLTVEELEAGLKMFAKLGTLPNEGIWFIRASSYLRLHPEDCQRLKDLFGTAEMSSRGRQLIAELLASAGHPRAQQVLREVLSTPAAAEDQKGYLAMVQTLGRVQKPEPASLAFLARRIERGEQNKEGHPRWAAEYALGAAVGAIAEQGDASVALVSQYNQRLLEALQSGKSPEDRGAALAALGNTRLDENSVVIRAYATDASASVREQVAVSLRYAYGNDARGTLLELAGDQNASVSAAALHVLRDRKLTSTELTRLAEWVTSGKTDPTLDSLLVTLLASQAPEQVPASVVSFLLERNAGNGLFQARIRALLEGRRDG